MINKMSEETPVRSTAQNMKRRMLVSISARPRTSNRQAKSSAAIHISTSISRLIRFPIRAVRTPMASG